MPGATPDIADWVRRKRNLVNHFHKSSYAIGLRLQQRQTSLEERYGLSVRDYSVHGGAFPLTWPASAASAASAFPARRRRKITSCW